MRAQHPRNIQFPSREQPFENPKEEIRQPPMEQRTLRDYVMPNLDVVQGSINRSTINANNFEIKSAMIQMNEDPNQHLKRFRGSMSEDPNQYLKRFRGSTNEDPNQGDKYQQVLKRLNQLEMGAAKMQVQNQPTLTNFNAIHYDESNYMEVNYVENRGYNTYSNTYNPEWRDHPNLRWGENQAGSSNQGNQNVNALKSNAPYQPQLPFRVAQDQERKSTYSSNLPLSIRVSKVEEGLHVA
ncbi:GATA zinc finger domain-containing protein 14-like [Gossypium australe]|uniref:GATA zinc finger domain-containing protein 14-like n=1 Tax=Gossypium australe TaxID=47621 RepID=A0A5B6VZG0_9ROSI|nr:GATA zinc finger domain-containing protein 14-like [Gossypium australe]